MVTFYQKFEVETTLLSDRTGDEIFPNMIPSLGAFLGFPLNKIGSISQKCSQCGRIWELQWDDFWDIRVPDVDFGDFWDARPEPGRAPLGVDLGADLGYCLLIESSKRVSQPQSAGQCKQAAHTR